MKIYTIGGYNKVGKNLTAIESGDEIVILDMGLDMEEVALEGEELEELSTKATFKTGAIPDDSQLYEQRDKVKAIVIGHGHLDHVGAVPKLAGAYDCPIIATPFTMKIMEQRIREDRKSINNERIPLNAGDHHWVSNNIEIEFIHVTHSIPDAVLIAVHTPEGTVLYSLDFRFDEQPVLGRPSDYDRLKRLGGERVKVLIGDSTRVQYEGACTSETEIKNQLKYRLDQIYEDGESVFVSTFSSHIERIKSMVDVNAGRRKIAFLGRSLKEYSRAASELGLLDLSGIKVVSYYDEMNEMLSQISAERKNWLVICTGNQGEPGSALNRIAHGDYALKIREGDNIIFSSSVIPTAVNEANRYKMEKKLKVQGARLHQDLHTSGHAKREDNRRMIRMVKPGIIIPAHGNIQMLASFAALAREEGYTLNENLFICEDGNVVEI